MKQQYKCESCGGSAKPEDIKEIPAKVTIIGAVRIGGKPGARWTCRFCGTVNEVAPSGNISVGGDIVGGDQINIIRR